MSARETSLVMSVVAPGNLPKEGEIKGCTPDTKSKAPLGLQVPRISDKRIPPYMKRAARLVTGKMPKAESTRQRTTDEGQPA